MDVIMISTTGPTSDVALLGELPVQITGMGALTDVTQNVVMTTTMAAVIGLVFGAVLGFPGRRSVGAMKGAMLGASVPLSIAAVSWARTKIA